MKRFADPGASLTKVTLGRMRLLARGRLDGRSRAVALSAGQRREIAKSARRASRAAGVTTLRRP